jgi:hypothetical protein
VFHLSFELHDYYSHVHHFDKGQILSCFSPFVSLTRAEFPKHCRMSCPMDSPPDTTTDTTTDLKTDSGHINRLSGELSIGGSLNTTLRSKRLHCGNVQVYEYHCYKVSQNCHDTRRRCGKENIAFCDNSRHEELRATLFTDGLI